jgi:RNA polymerase sigma-70 factor, ECF subfamily
MSKQLATAEHEHSQDWSAARCSGNPALHGLGTYRLLQTCLRSRDELLWTEFIRRSQPVIAGVVIKTALRWARSTPCLVDDLVQETYLKLFANNARALRRFVCHHENALYGFLKVVASNTVQDHFRCSYSQKRGSGREEESIDGAGIERTDGRGFREGRIGRALSTTDGLHQGGEHHSPHHGLERRILLREIDAYLKARSSKESFARDYTIFWLYYREGLTAKAISRIPSVGLTVKGVESTLLRLTRLVRKRLEQRSNGLRSPHMIRQRMQPAE